MKLSVCGRAPELRSAFAADNAAGVFYGIAYLVMFAIPLVGLRAVRADAPLWLRIAAISGFVVTLLFIVFSIFPIVEVVNSYWFAAKIVFVALLFGRALFSRSRWAFRPAVTLPSEKRLNAPAVTRPVPLRTLLRNAAARAV